MTKYLILFFVFCSTFCLYGQSSKLIIDPNIKNEVEKRITSIPEFDKQNMSLIYQNIMSLNFYENDSLIVSIKEEDDKKMIFKSFYYQMSDTLCIDGAYGLFGGAGFSIKIKSNEEASLFHMLASDEFPSYAYNESDSLIFRLEVPCKDTKIILSEIPDKTNKGIIYGYVEFKSADYYSTIGYVDGQEILPRRKQRADMKIYFKSSYIDLSKI